GDIRKASLDERIPLRKSVAAAQALRGEVAERVAGLVLVAARIEQKCAAERGIREEERGDGVDQRGPRGGVPRRGRRCRRWRGHFRSSSHRERSWPEVEGAHRAPGRAKLERSPMQSARGAT